MTTEQQEREAPQAEIEGRLYAWQMACGCRFVYRIELPTADQQPVFLIQAPLVTSYDRGRSGERP